MSPRTIYLSRLLGLFLLVVAAGEVAQRATMIEFATAMLNAPALLFSGLLTVLAGLAMVLAHNVWRGGAMPLIVTILGWLALIKGACSLMVPVSAWAGMLHAVRYADFYPFWVAVHLVLGAYLTYAGFSTHQPGR